MNFTSPTQRYWEMPFVNFQINHDYILELFTDLAEKVLTLHLRPVTNFEDRMGFPWHKVTTDPVQFGKCNFDGGQGQVCWNGLVDNQQRY